ncbi:MAG TPA: hypothetical protein VFQ53_16550 [Kofleriaceae bacterium]|nr:hypothetical protein [Kofleriaceae bacterium]
MAAIAIAAAFGCGKSADECKAEARTLVDYLRQLEPQPPIAIPGDLALATRAGIARRAFPGRSALAIGVGPERFVVAGRAVATPRELEEQLARTHDVVAGAGSRVVYVAVDRRAPWERVAAVAAAAQRDGFEQVAFVFAEARGLPPAPPSKLDATLAQLPTDPANRAMELARLLREHTADCPALAAVFGQLASVEGDRTPILLRGIEDALPACKCDVDPQALRALLAHAIQGRDVIRWIVVDVAPSAPPLALPAALPWEQAAGKLADGDRVWLVAQ